MAILYFLLLILLLYGLLFFVVPKGNPLHEIIHLGPYLVKMYAIPVRQMVEEKYRFGSHHRQYLLYFPPAPGSPRRKQVIIYLHGGGWQFGRPEMFRANAKVFTDQGYGVFALSYRRILWYRYPSIREDISDGFKKVLEIMEAKSLSDKKILLGGMSAGGQLMGLLLYDKAELHRMELDSPDLFSGLFLCGAPMDFLQMRPSLTLRLFAGRRSGPIFELANPVNYLKGKEKKPVLAIHGTKDGLVEYDSILSYAAKMNSLNPGVLELHTLPGGTHLDAGSWVLGDGTIRQLLLGWIEKREEELE